MLSGDRSYRFGCGGRFTDRSRVLYRCKACYASLWPRYNSEHPATGWGHRIGSPQRVMPLTHETRNAWHGVDVSKAKLHGRLGEIASWYRTW